jgi:hypothetical protein
MLMAFYFFRKNINAYFDQIDAYSTAHPELGQWFMTAMLILAVGSLGVIGGYGVYLWKIEPWRDRRREAKLERERFEKIKEELVASRPQINLLESNMESFSVMLSHEQYQLNVGRRKRVRGS